MSTERIQATAFGGGSVTPAIARHFRAEDEARRGAGEQAGMGGGGAAPAVVRHAGGVASPSACADLTPESVLVPQADDK